MKISNNFIRRILDSCDLIGILGRILAYLLEFNKTFTTPPHLKISSTQGFGGIVAMDCNYLNTILYCNETYPLPKLGEGRVRVHSDIKNICHPELVSGSYQHRMDKFNVSCLCEEHHDEANQNKFFLDCFTFVRNDKEKVGVECQ